MTKTTKSMLTAQRLADGRVVYLAPDRSWTQCHNDGWLADAAEIDAALPSAKAQTEVVVEPYRIEVDVDETSRIHHRSTRERIRAEGPSAVLRRFGYERPSERRRVAGVG